MGQKLGCPPLGFGVAPASTISYWGLVGNQGI